MISLIRNKLNVVFVIIMMSFNFLMTTRGGATVLQNADTYKESLAVFILIFLLGVIGVFGRNYDIDKFLLILKITACVFYAGGMAVLLFSTVYGIIKNDAPTVFLFAAGGSAGVLSAFSHRRVLENRNTAD